MLFEKIELLLKNFSEEQIPAERKDVLQGLTAYIKTTSGNIHLNFICTHNSRRSHLAQVWAYALCNYFQLDFIDCYSGGTEETAVYPVVMDTLRHQGFEILQLTSDTNPVFALKSHPLDRPLILFSKKYNHRFNPPSDFVAIMTCDSANEACPLVSGALRRFSILYEDPKKYDGSPQQVSAYMERSLQIAQELWYVFKQVAGKGKGKF